jgi:hypothetical protein
LAVKAAEAWVALCRAGVTLEDDGGGLRLRLPPNVEPGPWLELGRTFGAHLYPLASGAWRAEVEGWPEGLRDEWDERASLRALDDGLMCDEAERAAFLEVRERALAPHAATLNVLRRELGAMLVRLEARSLESGAAAGARASGKGPAPVTLVRSRARHCPACGQHEAGDVACGCCYRTRPRGHLEGQAPNDESGREGGSAARKPGALGFRSPSATRQPMAPRGLALVASEERRGVPLRGR